MEETLGAKLSQVARLMRRNFDERARKIGATRPQAQVLTLLARHPGINQGGIADLLEVEPITVARMIDRLQEAELVERRADPSDRRAWRLHLTARGEALVEQLYPCGVATTAASLDGVSEEDRAMLDRVLEQMRANLSRKSEGAPPRG
jgi:DNA-binding MarR family transcriptional regulator